MFQAENPQVDCAVRSLVLHRAKVEAQVGRSFFRFTLVKAMSCHLLRGWHVLRRLQRRLTVSQDLNSSPVLIYLHPVGRSRKKCAVFLGQSGALAEPRFRLCARNNKRRDQKS